MDASTGLHCTQRDGTTFAFCSGALHRSNKDRASEAAEAAAAPGKGRASPRPCAPPVALPGVPMRHRRRPPVVRPTEPERLPAGYAVTRTPTPTERPRPRAAPARPGAWLHRPGLVLLAQQHERQAQADVLHSYPIRTQPRKSKKASSRELA